MTRLFIFSLMAIVVALWVSLYLGFPADPGYLLIAFGNTTFETSLFAMLIAVATFYLLVRIVLAAWRVINPYRWFRAGRELAHRSRSRSRSRTVEGMLYLTRRNWRSAYSLLLKSADDEDASVVNFLAAAYAAYELGERENWLKCLARAEQEYPAAHTTINSLKAQLLHKTGQLEQCLALLEMLRKNSLNDAPLLTMLKEVYMELEDWQKLQSILSSLQELNIISDEEISLIRKRIVTEQLIAAAALESAGPTKEDNKEQINALRKLWKKSASQYREEADVVRTLVDLYLVLHAREEAAHVLEQSLSRKWNQALLLYYGEVDFGVSSQQLLAAEGWLTDWPSDPTLFLTLGRIAMRNKLWGKAREYFEASIKVAPSAAACGELSRLLKCLGEEEASAKYLQRYSELLGADLPELPMPAAPAKAS